MTHTPNRLLALKPGMRELGVTVFQGEELLYYGIKTITPRETPQELLTSAVHLLKKLLVGYQPSRLVIEQMCLLPDSPSFLLVVAKKLKAAARRSGLTVSEYPLVEVRRFFCRPEKATRLLTARRISERYPHLARRLGTAGDFYYAPLFDALALGLYGLHELPKGELNAMDEEDLKEVEARLLQREPTSDLERQEEPNDE